MGSPGFAIPTLRRLVESEHEVAAVYTQPDRPAGRGRKPAPPPVKTLAQAHGLDVRQPASISKPPVVDELRAFAADAGVIAAFGQILKQPVLDAFTLGALNVHASLLPRWRGAAPVAAAILAGDTESGATIMQVRLELDAGPMLGAIRIPIDEADTTGTLSEKIAHAGADLLLELLPRWAEGSLVPVEQDASQATYAPRITKSDALIHWQRDTAEQISRQVRAYNPWPVAHTYVDGKLLRILVAAPLEPTSDAPPGTVIALDGGAGFAVATRDGALGVVTVQPAGGRSMPATAFVRGHPRIIGKRFAESP